MVRDRLPGRFAGGQVPPGSAALTMKLRRIIAVGTVGYLAWKAIEAATRPIPCQPLRGVRVPSPPFEEQVAAVVHRRQAQMRRYQTSAPPVSNGA